MRICTDNAGKDFEMSTNSEINEILRQVLERTFEKVQKAFDNNRECLVKRGEKSSSNEVTTLVFPKYGEHRQGIEDKTRISEQELRFAFTEAFEEIAKENNLFYSVETPTESKYLFNGENTPKITDDKEGVGQSGNFDFVIHDDKLKRICLIEFKSGYPESKSFKKDFLKLANPNEDVDEINPLRYFIHLVEKFERNKIDNRLKSANNIIDVRLNNKAVTVNYVLFSLSEDENAIKSDLSDIIKEKSHIKYYK
jgi:hypothetical protein